MIKRYVYAGFVLCVILAGCTTDYFSADSEIIVTIRGLSAFGEWERDFIGMESQVDEFISETAQVVHAVTKKFDGSIDVDISIEGQLRESISAIGDDLDIVPAAIIAAHDITALRLGFLPKGSVDDLNITGAKTGSLPCACAGAGCCCSSALQGGDCTQIFLSCEGCRKKDYCVDGTECWVGPGKNK